MMYQKFIQALLLFFLKRYSTRRPDFVVGTNYLSRWWVIPRNPLFNIYLHKFTGSDDDRALHDHPWANLSILLHGEYIEHLPGDRKETRKAGAIVMRLPSSAHRLEINEGPVWTLFMTGPWVRHWGFHCPQGWRHWRDFTSPRDPGQIGRGCE